MYRGLNYKKINPNLFLWTLWTSVLQAITIIKLITKWVKTFLKIGYSKVNSFDAGLGIPYDINYN